MPKHAAAVQNVSDEHRHRFPDAKWLPTWWNGADPTQPNIIIDYMADNDIVQMLWDPVLYTSNSVSSKGLEKTAGMVMIAGDGSVYRSVRVIDTLNSGFNFRWFP